MPGLTKKDENRPEMLSWKKLPRGACESLSVYAKKGGIVRQVFVHAFEINAA